MDELYVEIHIESQNKALIFSKAAVDQGIQGMIHYQVKLFASSLSSSSFTNILN